MAAGMTNTTFQTHPADTSNCTLATCDVAASVFNYRPRREYTDTLIVLFAISLVLHLVQGVMYKTWTFLIGMGIACAMEIGGYFGRYFAWTNPFVMNYFLVQICLLTMAPVFYCAGVYLCLSRIVTLYGASVSRLKPKMYTYIFISCDVISLILQGAGGGITSATDDRTVASQALDVMIAGLSFQVITLFVFSGLCIEFAYRVYTNQEKLDHTTEHWRRQPRWIGFLCALALAVVLITTRSIYRVVELNGGWDSTLNKVQVPFFVCEGLFLVATSFALNIFHPGYAFGPYWIRDAPNGATIVRVKENIELGEQQQQQEAV